MRIVFMGTPQFAVPSLKALIEAGHEVCGVFSQPDKPVGRHQNKLKPTPVKECALSYRLRGETSRSTSRRSCGTGRRWPF